MNKNVGKFLKRRTFFVHVNEIVNQSKSGKIQEPLIISHKAAPNLFYVYFFVFTFIIIIIMREIKI